MQHVHRFTGGTSVFNSEFLGGLSRGVDGRPPPKLTVSSRFRNWQTAPFMEVEVAIRLLYMLGEALPASHGAHFSGDATKASALQDMMRTVGHVTLLALLCSVTVWKR